MINLMKKLFCTALLLASFIGAKAQKTASLQVDFGKKNRRDETGLVVVWGR